VFPESAGKERQAAVIGERRGVSPPVPCLYRRAEAAPLANLSLAILDTKERFFRLGLAIFWVRGR